MRKTILYLLILSMLAIPAVGQDDGESGEPQTEGAYRVGIQDVLGIVVWGEDDLTMNLMVRPDGMITLPLVNDIQVVGKSTAEIREIISERLKTFIKDPAVTVILAEYNSFRVFVLGEVIDQGEFTFQQPTRFLQALAAAGGLTQYSKKDAVILRSVNGSDWRMPVDLKKLLTGSSSAQDPYLQPNDTIIVN